MAPANSRVTRQSLAEAELLPGRSTQAHFHPNTEEIYYILQGVGEIAIEGEVRSVVPCDAVAIPPGSRHQIRNSGNGILVFLCCCVPAYTHSDTVMCDPLFDTTEQAAGR